MFPSVDLLITTPEEGLSPEVMIAIAASSRRSGCEPWFLPAGRGLAARRLLAITNCKTDYVIEIRHSDSVGLGAFHYMQSILAKNKDIVGVIGIARVLYGKSLRFSTQELGAVLHLPLRDALASMGNMEAPIMFRRESIQESCFLGMEAGDEYSGVMTSLGALIQGEVLVNPLAVFTRVEVPALPYSAEVLTPILEIVDNCPACRGRIKNGK